MIEQVGEGSVSIGENCIVGAGAKIIFQRPARVIFGDYGTIGANVKLVVSGDVTIGDWATLHDDCLVLSTAGVTIGDHCWFGQNTIIDGTGGITIGNGVRVGMYSQLWSHAAAGERIEGCTLFAERPVTIGDDVWLVGSCIVASGISLGDRLVALIGSNITKSFPANIVIAGVPAAERPGLSFYKTLELDEKMALLGEWLHAAEGELGVIVESDAHGRRHAVRPADPALRGSLIFARDEADARQLAKAVPDATVCCVESKRYTKRLSPLEWRVLKYLAGNKARFFAIPAEPRAG